MIYRKNLEQAFVESVGETQIQLAWDVLRSESAMEKFASKYCSELSIGDANRDSIAILSRIWENKKTYETEVELRLACLNEILECYGVEYIESVKDTQHEILGISYLNAGDTYANTVIYDWQKEKWFINSYGDIVESQWTRFAVE